MYQGCSDNVKYGIGVSKEFVDGAERRIVREVENGSFPMSAAAVDGQLMINLHNNQAGRQVYDRRDHKIKFFFEFRSWKSRFVENASVME